MTNLMLAHERDRDRSSDQERSRDEERVAPGRVAWTSALVGPNGPMASGILHRKARDADGVSEDAAGVVMRAASSSGVPLPELLMRKFESSLAADLSGVRVHTGGDSAVAASAVGAKAYTIGNDIHFGAGYFDPSSREGEHLLAHEVAHTVQQHGGTPTMQHKLEVSSPGDWAEVEADRAADAMVSGHSVTVSGASGTMRVMRAADPQGEDEQLSPLRMKLKEQFDDYSNQVVGNSKFENIIRKKDWDDIKNNEAFLRDVNFVKSSVGMSTTPVATFTTCIATQGALLRDAFTSLHLKIKQAPGAKTYPGQKGKPRDDFGFSSRLDDPAAFHKGGVGAGCPKVGDMIVLSPRGSAVNQADQGLRYTQGQQADAQKQDGKVEDLLAAAVEKATAAQDALAQVKAAERSGMELARKQQAYDRAQAAVTLAAAAAARAAKALASANDSVDKATTKLDKAREEDRESRAKLGAKAFQFQHVCYLAGAPKARPDGKEEWPMFGGGQKVADDKGAMHEGSAKSVGIYDPTTNELADGDNRSGPNWVYGWIDVDALVDQ